VLESDMDEVVGAGKNERTEGRTGYRSGYYVRTLVTRVGKLELQLPRDRQDRFRTEVFERYQAQEVWPAPRMELHDLTDTTTRV
jgi:putative transposase